MIKVKDIYVKPISSKDARRIVRRLHYSGKVCQNSQIHLGAFAGEKCLGVMQFGGSLNNRYMSNTVKGSKITEFLELNRMAFDDRLPRNSESRCLSVALRIIKKTYPFMKWIVTFADGCQCGDGTIYRASGFDLIGIKKNTTLLEKDGHVVAEKSFNNKRSANGSVGSVLAKTSGWSPLTGYQLKYIKFLHESERANLSVDILPYSDIDRLGAGMYKGIKRTKHSDDAPAIHAGEGGSTPTCTLQ